MRVRLAEPPCRVDQPDARERLGEVAEQFPGRRVGFLGEEAKIVGMGGRTNEPVAGAVVFSGEGETLDQPVGAEEPRRVARPTSDEGTITQFAGDGFDRGAHPVVGRRQKPNQRQEEYRRVEVVRAERPTIRARVRSTRVPRPRPGWRRVRVPSRVGISAIAEAVGEQDGPVERNPAHHLRRCVVALLVTGFAHPRVGFRPACRGPVGERDQHPLYRRLERAEHVF